MKRWPPRISFRIAFALFILASIALGVAIERNIETHDLTVYRWPTLESFTERRTYIFKREVAYSLIDGNNQPVSTVDARDLFGMIRASTVFS